MLNAPLALHVKSVLQLIFLSWGENEGLIHSQILKKSIGFQAVEGLKISLKKLIHSTGFGRLTLGNSLYMGIVDLPNVRRNNDSPYG
jgi:hypothetical protein